MIRVFFSSTIFHAWVIKSLTCCYTKTMFCVWRDVDFCEFELNCSTIKNWNSCRLLKNRWQCIVTHNENCCFFVLFRLTLFFRCCWIQMCFCFKWSIMILSFRQTYWHCVNFNWHCNSSMCNFNAEMTAFTRLNIFNSIEYWSTSNHDWIAVCKFFVRCLFHLWWDSW